MFAFTDEGNNNITYINIRIIHIGRSGAKKNMDNVNKNYLYVNNNIGILIIV